MPPLLAVLMAAGVIVLAVQWNRPSRYAGLFRIIGLTTYPLYLLHQSVNQVLMPRLLPIMPDLAAFAIAAAVAVVLSAAVAVTVEPWLQRRLRALLSVRPRSLPVMAD